MAVLESVRDIKPTDFFQKDLPKDIYVEYNKKNCSKRHLIMKNNYMSIINKYFDKKIFVRNNVSKIFNINYGIKNLQTLKSIISKDFKDFYSLHLTQSFLKSTFEDVWSNEYLKIHEACFNKFRADNDLGTTLCRYWQLLNGKFSPSKVIGKYFSMSDNNKKLIKVIQKRKYKIVCINDANINIDFEKAKNEVNKALDSILCDKSEFEL